MADTHHNGISSDDNCPVLSCLKISDKICQTFHPILPLAYLQSFSYISGFPSSSCHSILPCFWELCLVQILHKLGRDDFKWKSLKIACLTVHEFPILCSMNIMCKHTTFCSICALLGDALAKITLFSANRLQIRPSIVLVKGRTEGKSLLCISNYDVYENIPAGSKLPCKSRYLVTCSNDSFTILVLLHAHTNHGRSW